MTRAETLRRAAYLAVAVILVGSLPLLLGNNYFVQVGATTGALIVAVIGFNLVLGETGLLSLGHAAFFGVGAYTFAVTRVSEWPLVLAVVAALALPAVLAVLIGIVTLRVRHLYFAIATFGIAEIIRNVIREWEPVTGGVLGVSVPRVEILGRSFSGANGAYPLILGVIVVAVFAHAWVSSSALGRRARTVRDDELGAEALGVPIQRTSLAMFVIGAVFAAAAGVLHGMTLTFIDPSILEVHQSIVLLSMLIVGGSGSVAGAVVGGAIISITPEVLRFVEHWWEIVFGTIILLAILSGKRGIVGFVADLWHRIRSRQAEASSLELAPVVERPFTPNGDPQALVVSDVGKYFGGVRALDGVDVRFEPGEVHALIGPNGSGKSTLVNVITGIYSPDRGTVSLGDVALQGRRPDQIARAGIARTFQHTRAFEELTVIDHVLPMVELGGLEGGEARAEAKSLLAATGLEGTADLPVTRLPHAHLRLLEIARALALRPRVLLLDEPAAGLSGEERDVLAAVIRLLEHSQVAVVVIEHNMPFVLDLAARVTVLGEGTVIARGAPNEIVNDPLVKAAYLGADEEETADDRPLDRVGREDQP